MLGKPASKSNSGDVGRGGYEFGEYDGVMDVEAILHTTVGASPNLTGSLTVADGDIGGYGNHVSLQSDNRNGSVSTPLGRGAPRKPARMSAGPACSGDSQSTMPSPTAAAPRYPVAVAGKGSDGAAASTAGRRTNSSYLSAEADAHDASVLPTRQGTRKPMYSDDVVYLPAIVNQQQMRKKGSDAFPSRARAAFSAPDPSNVTNSATVNHSRTRASGAGAKSVITGNLESLQAPNDSCSAAPHNQHNGPATAVAPRPPYHAPPLSPLTRKGRQSTDDTNGTHAAGSVGIFKSVGASLQEVSARHRLVLEGTAKRGESVEAGEGSRVNGHCGRASMHNTMGSGDVVATSKTNGWVKEEARRLDQRACTSCSTAASCKNEPQASGDVIDGFKSRNTIHQVASQFPRERMKDKSSKSSTSTQSPTADSRDSALGHNSSADGNTCTKLNTSPAPVTPKAHVWAGDYEMASTPGVGSTNFSIVPTPKVCLPRPLAGGFKASTTAEGSTSTNRSCAKSPTRTSAQNLHPPPSEDSVAPSVSGAAPPTESAITLLRKVFTRPQKPASNTNGAAAQAAPNACPIPQVPLTSPPKSPTMATTVPQSANASSPPAPSKTAITPGHAVAVAKSGKSLSAPHTPALSHRSTVNAADIIQRPHAHYSSAGQQAPLTSGSSRVPLLDQAPVSGMYLPYSDQRRAALEAWADVPVLTVTIRGQSLTPTQRAREIAKTRARPAAARQLYAPVNGQGRQEVAGEPCDLNYDVHNVAVQLRHRNRPLMINYPPRLPLEVDMRPRMRRQRTPRSFYGNGMPHAGDAWFKDALNDARMVDSPDIESMEKHEEAEFIRNGGDPATRRNRYGQANNAHANQQQHQSTPQHGNVGAADVGTVVDGANLNPIRMEQSAS